jgi:hypothetical protein
VNHNWSVKKTAGGNNISTDGFLKHPASANVIYANGCIKKTASANVVFTGGFLKQPVSANVISTGGYKTTASEKADFYWSLALTALNNDSVNSFRIATIKLLCSTIHILVTTLFQSSTASAVDKRYVPQREPKSSFGYPLLAKPWFRRLLLAPSQESPPSPFSLAGAGARQARR